MGDREYICKSCHWNLKTSENKDPQMPKYAVAVMKGNAVLYWKWHVQSTDIDDKENRKNKRAKITSVDASDIQNIP